MTASRAERQKFSIGYHLNSWDLAGLPLTPAIEFLAKQGFGWFEILAFTSLSDQFARKYMQLGHQGPMGVMTDTDILRRYAILSEAQSELGIRLSSLYVNATFTNPVLWPVERDVLVSLARLLKGFGSPVLVLGGGPSEASGNKHEAQDYKDFCRALEDMLRVKCDVNYMRNLPSLHHDGKIVSTVMDAIADHFGKDAVQKRHPSLGAEDFSLVGEKVPAFQLGIGSGAEGRRDFLHNSDYQPDEACIKLGVVALASAAVRLLDGSPAR